jgi:hypothetical protein
MSVQIAGSPSIPNRHTERDEYFCPVCGIELARTDFDTPERDYYCPFCSTRQRPAIV